MTPAFVIQTLGCKANQYESAALGQLLTRAGLTPAGPTQQPHLVLLHSCAVTAEAARKCRQSIRRLRRRYPQALLLVTGCYAEDPDRENLQSVENLRFLGHDRDVAAAAATLAKALVAGQDISFEPEPAGSSGINQIYDAMEGAGPVCNTPTSIKAGECGPVKEIHDPPTPLGPLETFPDRTRAIVKVQDGCDCFCSYCIVPHRRRRIASKPIDQALAEIGQLVLAGHREIVLCGIALGAFGCETTRPGTETSRLPELLAEAAHTPGLARLRMSSLHPAEVSDDLLAVMAENKTVCPHLHLPLQSGSNSVLNRMNRPYTAEEFLDTCRRVRQRLDRPAITTDVIVGFPGESDEDFRRTCDLAREVGFSRMHIFPFSPRPGTAAWQWRDHRPAPQVVADRCKQLQDLAEHLAGNYRRQFDGQTVDVLVERPGPGPVPAAEGLTDRYLQVAVEPDPPEAEIGKMIRGRIFDVDAQPIRARRV